jgi:ribosome-binding factor A
MKQPNPAPATFAHNPSPRGKKNFDKRFLSPRTQRIGDEIQRELAKILAKKTNDPRLHAISITAVDVSPDMANATILMSALDEAHIPEILKTLNNAAGFFRRELAHSLNLRITPRLKFSHDKSIAHANHLSALINAVNPPDPESPEEDV